MDHAEKAFRELRRVWFNANLRHHSPEREWEEDKVAQRREKDNEKYKKIYDKQTEAILKGKDICVAPYCFSDLCKGKKENG